MERLSWISDLGNNSVSLEKMLRLAQSLFRITSALQSSSKQAEKWSMAMRQMSLCRRFFRLHKWIDAFSATSLALSSPSSHPYHQTSIPKFLMTCQYTFLGWYFLLEMFTIGDAMGLTDLAFGPWLTVECNRFWMYGILCGLGVGVYDGVVGQIVSAENEQRGIEKKGKGKRKGKGKVEGAAGSKRIGSTSSVDGQRVRVWEFKQLVVDACDLLIPMEVVGWPRDMPLLVGGAMAVSTVLQLSDIMRKQNH